MRQGSILSQVAGTMPAMARPGAWRPVPRASDRSAWQTVDPHTAALFLEEARSWMGTPWPPLPAHLWLAFVTEGDRQAHERPYFARRERLATAVVAASLTLEEALLTEVVDGVWTVCEETVWQLPAHDAPGDEREALPSHPTVDLFAAETASLLAWTDLVLAEQLDAVSPALRRRLREEIRRRVLRPYTGTRDWFWYPRGSNNWNPWIHSNLIAAALLVEHDPDKLRTLLLQAAQGLDNYVAGLPADGGCDEGIDYWWRAAGSVFESLEWLHSASNSDASLFTHGPLPQAARYPLVTHVADGWQVNFGDGAARWDRGSSRNGATPRLLHLIGRRVGDAQVQAHARALRGTDPVALPNYSLGRVLPTLFDSEWETSTPASFPLLEHSWLPQTQVLTARQRQGEAAGPFVAVKGGHNDESHNHNDVGSFMVAWDGQPLIIDAGVGTYTAQTFSKEDRYRIWTMRSSYHNLPIIDGWEQGPGAEKAAAAVTGGRDGAASRFAANIAGAYPAAAAVLSWVRALELDRDHTVVRIEEHWELAEPAPVIWRYLLRGDVQVSGNRVVISAGSTAVQLQLPAVIERVYLEEIPIDDERLSPVWDSGLHALSAYAQLDRSGGATHTISAATPALGTPGNGHLDHRSAGLVQP